MKTPLKFLFIFHSNFPMAFSLPSSLSIKIREPCCDVRLGQTSSICTRSQKHNLVHGLAADGSRYWSFITGSKFAINPKLATVNLTNKSHVVHASWFANAQIASYAFTLGTTSVLPFYALMVLAPNSELTKKSTQSNIPYVVLGLLYAYLLYLSWTPESIQLLFASKYWLPELSGMLKMFSSEMTLASAWIHLLVVDLFAARQVFHDGLENKIETRHSVSLCLFSCPIGVLTHVITKAITTRTGHNNAK